HSYEEPAYDVYPIRSAPAGGAGRIGSLPASLTLDEMARKVQQFLGGGAVQLVGEPGTEVQRVAIICGSGDEFLGNAVRAGADVFLTGEVRYHDCLAARAQTLALCLPGHHATERFAMDELARRLHQHWPDLEVFPSRDERDPLRWIASL